MSIVKIRKCIFKKIIQIFKTVQPSRSNRQLYQPSRNREENPRPFFSVDDMLNFTELDNNPRASSSSSRQREDIINYEDFL